MPSVVEVSARHAEHLKEACAKTALYWYQDKFITPEIVMVALVGDGLSIVHLRGSEGDVTISVDKFGRCDFI
jgi:hypothetical protein